MINSVGGSSCSNRTLTFFYYSCIHPAYQCIHILPLFCLPNGINLDLYSDGIEENFP